MAGDPLVYIIVLTWNGREDTIACLKSLQEITYPNYRILLVDNASTDGTVEAIRRDFPAVEVLVNESNFRFAGGNNAGIRHAVANGADYILLLNNDTTVAPDFLTELVRAIHGDEHLGMASPKIYYYDQPRRIWFAGGRIEWWRGWFSHIGIREDDRGQYNAPARVDYLTACCVLVKRTVIERVGVLDEGYFMYGEDADWSIRAARAGYGLQYVPSAAIWHKLSVSSGGHFSWFKNWNKLKSQIRLVRRYAKAYHWLTIPIAFPVSVVAAALAARFGRNVS
jgi:GT2 family glycosyltransferase